jgi:DNA-directed RNA polymerase specialized sigma subunit
MKRSEEKINEMRNGKIYPGMRNDGMPASHNGSDLSGYASMLDEEERKYLKARYKRLCLCRDISNKIEQMENEDEKDVLMNRYIKLMKWEDICVKMNCSWKQIHRIHARALKNFQIF